MHANEFNITSAYQNEYDTTSTCDNTTAYELIGIQLLHRTWFWYLGCVQNNQDVITAHKMSDMPTAHKVMPCILLYYYYARHDNYAQIRWVTMTVYTT